MRRGSRYTLTVRHGSAVRREDFEALEPAVTELERRAEAIRAEGPLESVSALRDFEPAQQVHARLEISTGGWLRGRDAGVDVMGDGSVVPYQGGIRRRRLEPREKQSAYEAVARVLDGASR
jgi:hypothetical protein